MTKMGRPKSENTKKNAEKHNMTTTDVVLRGVEAFISKQE